MRRQPKQLRSRQTVEAVLDAVLKILKRSGIAGVTTNHIAAVAGVSIGSVYQYFPDKRAIFAALHDHHVGEMARLVERTLVDHAAAPLDELVRALVEALIEAHGSDPELHHALADVPNGADGTRSFQARLRNALRLAISARAEVRYAREELDRLLFVLPVMIDALAHGVAHRGPGLSLTAAKREAVRAVLAYLHA